MDRTEPAVTTTTADLLTEDELAELLRLSLSSIQKWRSHGKGPAFIKIDDRGTVRYRRSTVETWLNQRTRFVTDGNVAANGLRRAGAIRL